MKMKCWTFYYNYHLMYYVGGVWAPRPRFPFTFSAFFFFFFFLPAFVDFGRQILLLWTVYALFTQCAYTVHILKNIKNGSHDTIYTFKYYFATVFSVFRNNKFNPNTPNKLSYKIHSYMNYNINTPLVK